MNIIKATLVAGMLLMASPVQALEPSCKEDMNNSFSLWHENFMQRWENSGRGFPTHEILVDSVAERYMAAFNALPPPSNLVADEVHIYRHDTAINHGVIFTLKGCMVVAGSTPPHIVEMLLSAPSGEIKGEDTDGFRFNPHLQEIRGEFDVYKGDALL